MGEQREGVLHRSDIIAELISPSTRWVEITEPQPAIEHPFEDCVTQIPEDDDELATALFRVKQSIELLLSDRKIADPTEVLAQAERALKAASMAKNVA
jgi:hypothetical protein